MTYGTTQVLRCNPNALRFDPATLASKLATLRKAGLPPSIVRSIVRDAPRCLSAGAKSLGDRVSNLKKAFPSIPLERLLREAPCLLQKQIVPADQARRGIDGFACFVAAWRLACDLWIFLLRVGDIRFRRCRNEFSMARAHALLARRTCYVSLGTKDSRILHR